jgi:ABC-type antimicrobial peptide transport system permease subunit
MGIQLAEGRDFSLEHGTDATAAFLVNEEVVKIMGVPSGVNQSFSFAGREGTIVGVMKNFHYQPLQRQIEPIAFMISKEHINYILIRVKPDDIEASVTAVDRIWQEVLPEFPLEYRFLDQDFDRMYRAEQRLGSLTRLFAGFAIFVAGLGLFGLAAFAAEQRTKEIGIRKVLGASSIQLVLLLCREFFWLVTIASVLAWIAGGYIMYRWLESFAYRTGLDPVVFAGSGLAALLVAMATVSYQAIRAARINPAESLKHE